MQKFGKALSVSMQGFSWQEKADFIEALMGYIQALQKGGEDAPEFFTEKLMKAFRSKLKPAADTQLLKHLDKGFALVEFGIISNEIFNSLPPGEQGMTEEEYQNYLGNALRVLKTEQYFHYVYQSDKEESTAQDSLQGTAIKGRIQRAAGDNLTKLNQEQTSLFIDYLKQGRVVLRDEYLNDKQAGLAFHILTGYSAETLRIKQSAKEIAKIKNKENLTEIYNALTQLTILIGNDIKQLKKT